MCVAIITSGYFFEKLSLWIIPVILELGAYFIANKGNSDILHLKFFLGFTSSHFGTLIQNLLTICYILVCYMEFARRKNWQIFTVSPNPPF